jgi:hypothetical protein
MPSLFERYEEDEDTQWFKDTQPDDDPLLPPTQMTDLKRIQAQVSSDNLKGQVLNIPEKLVPVSDKNTLYNQLSFVRDINYCFLKNQGIYFCIYGQGPLGLGKSSLGIQALMQLLGTYDYDGNLVEPCMDWETLRAHIVYHPLTFIKIIQHLKETKTRIKSLVWDDSGIYLNSKDWQKEEAKEMAKWFQTARTYVGSIVLTTPSPALLLRDIRRLSMITIEVKFQMRSFGGFDSLYSHDRRLAFSYDHWYLPDLTKIRTHARAKDRFKVTLPDDIYYPYKRLRDSYNDLQIESVVKSVTGKVSTEDKAFDDGVDVNKICPQR